MIDKIELECRNNEIMAHLTPDFFRGRGDVEIMGYNKYAFKLFNSLLSRKTSGYLKITCSHINEKGDYVPFKIGNSIRKWQLGKESEKDLSKKDFEEAINQLLEILNLSHEALRYFDITHIELGLNIKMKRPYAEAKKMIFGYGENRYKRNSYETGDTFHVTSKYVTFYDKKEEISTKIKKCLIKNFDDDKYLKDNADKNITRIEVKYRSQSKIKKELGFTNLEDCVTHFNTLYCHYWNELSNIQFSDVFTGILPSEECLIKNYTEFLFHFAEIGMKYVGAEYVGQEIKRMKNRNARMYVRKKLLENPSKRTCLYDKRAFMIDIRNRMLLSMYHSGCLNLVKPLFLDKPIA